jgi:TonB family protein
MITKFPSWRNLLPILVATLAAAAQTGPSNGAQPPLVSEAHVKQAIKYKVDPEYPATARQFRVTGVVVAEFTIGTDGKVESVDSATGNQLLTGAVKTALRKWVFTPFEMDGKPIRVRSTMTFTFRL